MHGPEILIPLIALVGFFGSIITLIYMRYRSRHTERMALIESGRDASIFEEKQLSEKSSSLKTGMLLTGVGLGWFVGLMLEQMFDLNEALGVIPTVLIGGGLGLICFYMVESRKELD